VSYTAPLMPSTGKRGTAAEARLLKLATWLSNHGEPVTRQQVYEAFPDDYAGKDEAREKKWTRDKQDLRKLGIPVQFLEEEGREGAYLVEATSCTLPRLDFAPDEASVVWMAGLAALRTHDHPLADDLETALRKLVVGAKGLPPKATLLEGEWSVPEPAALRKWLGTLADAIERRKRVKVAYRKSDGTVTQRLVDVYGYAWRRGHWIFAGHCHMRDAVRMFYLERVQSLAIAPAQAKKADYAIPADFDIRSWSRQETWDYFVHEPRAALVRFRGSLAALAPKLLPTARFSREPDNARVARLDVRNLGGLVRQALAWGPEAELLEPAEGREMAREILASLSSRLARETAG
jgi:predicted DNA-binding transcriptional regulator YafY